MSVYYLKYRPQKIKELDLKNIREQLTLLLSSKSIPHALLFSGPKGLGKTSSARIVAKSINCIKHQTPNTPPAEAQHVRAGKHQTSKIEPCNKCSLCKSIINGTCLDLIEIDAASNRGIDDIRELREKIKLSPAKAKKKIYIIDEVHMLTTPAFNALLKTLEEPPAHAFFILCTTEPEKLPETIISRCQRFNFHLAKPEEIVRSLKRIVNGEKLKISGKSLNLIAEKAQGGFRDASKVLQELAFSGKNISFKQVLRSLAVETAAVKDLLKWLADKNTNKALTWINESVNKGADLKVLTTAILEDLRKLFLNKFGLIEAVEDYDLSVEDIKKLIFVFDQASRQLKWAVIPQLPLELAIVEYCKKELKTPRMVVRQPAELLRGGGIKKSISDKWQEVLRLVKQDNHSVEALLKSTKLKEVKNDKITVDVFYQFHKEKLESRDNIELIERRIKEVFGKDFKIKYTIRR